MMQNRPPSWMVYTGRMGGNQPAARHQSCLIPLGIGLVLLFAAYNLLLPGIFNQREGRQSMHIMQPLPAPAAKTIAHSAPVKVRRARPLHSQAKAVPPHYVNNGHDSIVDELKNEEFARQLRDEDH